MPTYSCPSPVSRSLSLSPESAPARSRRASTRAIPLLTTVPLVLGLTVTMYVGLVVGPTTPKAAAMISADKSSAAVDWARSRRGTPYGYGSAGPNSFDCSGLTRWAYARVGKWLPHSSAAQARRTLHVSRDNRRPGDLVFFGGRGGVYHVAIYAGGGKIWHAPYSGTRVRKERLWTSQVFYGRVR